MIVKQKVREGFYASEVIENRFQVLESDIMPGSFMVYDLVKDDAIRGRDGTIAYMTSVDAAMAVAKGMAVPTVRAKAAKSSPKEKVARSKAPSANGLMNDLLKTTELSDAEISERVAQEFPGCTYCKPYHVKYRRKQLAAKG
jgi:hypothetical protein